MDTAIEQQIKEIEDEIFNTQKNKATEHHIGKLKAKLARLRGEAEKQSKKGGKGKGFSVKKSGDATVGIVGFPSIGKSTLLNQLTDAASKTGVYDFTTLDVIPGMLKYKGADIQLLDLPGMITGAARGRGRGREILSAVRSVDLILLMIDANHVEQLEVMKQELYDAGLRLNEKSPDVVISLRKRGGITVKSTVQLSYLSKELAKTIASEFVINADITIRQDITEEQLIDVFSKNCKYVSALVVVNKMELVSTTQLNNVCDSIRQQGVDVIPISALNGKGIELLKQKLFTNLGLIRVYMKPVGNKADYSEPLILKKNSTVEDACKQLHRDFQQKFRYAVVWGASAKHPGQNVGLDHILQDEDVLTIVMKI